MTTGVVVNARFLGRPVTGVERYGLEITRRLGDRVKLFRPDKDVRGFRGHVWEQLQLPRMLNGNVLWSPANTGPLGVLNQVVTVHDLSPLDHPEWFDARFAVWYRYLLPRLVKRVRRVITVSRFSKSRIVDRLGVPEERVVVIPNGVDPKFRPQPQPDVATIRRRRNLVGPYVLAVGSLEPRKNLHRLLRAWQHAGAVVDGVTLVIVGGFGPTFRATHLGAVPRGVRLIEPLGDQDLPALYAGSLGFVLPSIYEGFGLPALEAMACGAPVVASNTTAVPEVVGDAAIPIDPFDVESIATGLRRLVEDGALREECRRQGIAHAQRFNWALTADLTWRVLQKEVGHG